MRGLPVRAEGIPHLLPGRTPIASRDHLNTSDPLSGLSHPHGQDRPIEVALSNSFGFGGTNASIVFRGAP